MSQWPRGVPVAPALPSISCDDHCAGHPTAAQGRPLLRTTLRQQDAGRDRGGVRGAVFLRGTGATAILSAARRPVALGHKRCVAARPVPTFDGLLYTLRESVSVHPLGQPIGPDGDLVCYLVATRRGTLRSVLISVRLRKLNPVVARVCLCNNATDLRSGVS